MKRYRRVFLYSRIDNTRLEHKNNRLFNANRFPIIIKWNFNLRLLPYFKNII